MNVRYPSLILALIFYSGFVLAQSEIIARYDTIVNSNVLDAKQKSDAVNTLLNRAKTPYDKAFICYDYAKKIYRQSLKKAIFYTEKSCEIITDNNLYETHESMYKKSMHNLVRFYYKDENFYEAISTSNQLIKLLDSSSIKLGDTYSMKGHIYRELGNYERALNYYKKAEFFFKKIKSTEHLKKVYINFLNLYADLDETSNKETFFKYYNKIKTLPEEYKLSNKDNIKVLVNVGRYYDTLKEYKEAESILLQALILNQTSYSNDKYSITILTDIGVTQKKLGEIKKAKTSFQKAIDLSNKYTDFLDDCYNNLAEIYLLENNYKKALEYFDKSVKLLVPDYYNLNDSHFKNPTIPQLQTVTEKIDLLQYLADKARALKLYAEHTANNEYLKLALETLKLSDYLIDKVYFESKEKFSKLFWRKRGASIYNNAIAICYILKEPEKAFYFMEKSKALLLLENINELKARLKAKIPVNVRDRELVLQSNISQLSKHTESSDISSYLADSLQNKLLDAKEQYTNFVDSLEFLYPKYYQYKKAAKTLTLKQVQTNLNKDELVLSYNVTNNGAYLSVVSKSFCELYKLDYDSIINKIGHYTEVLKKPFSTIDDKTNFKNQSYVLFKKLVPFSSDINNLKDKKLIIILDKAIKDIPFESLVTNKDVPLSQAYLLNISDVRYTYSMSSLYKSLSQKSDYIDEFLNVSVNQFQDTTLVPLQENSSTFNYQNLFVNSNISGNSATKNQFLESYGNYKVVHISTHGGISQTKPWLAFYDEKLFLEDMYFKNQKAELVTLSACKTSQGEYKEGEGVMSIARGFVNAGAKSVYASLWNIDNKASAEVMSLVYENLKKGDKKDDALSNAKRAYLKLKQNTSQAAPFYWSGIILIGDDTEVFTSSNQLPTNILIMVLIIGLLFVFNKRETIFLGTKKNVN